MKNSLFGGITMLTFVFCINICSSSDDLEPKDTQSLLKVSNIMVPSELKNKISEEIAQESITTSLVAGMRKLFHGVSIASVATAVYVQGKNYSEKDQDARNIKDHILLLASLGNLLVETFPIWYVCCGAPSELKSRIEIFKEEISKFDFDTMEKNEAIEKIKELLDGVFPQKKAISCTTYNSYFNKATLGRFLSLTTNTVMSFVAGKENLAYPIAAVSKSLECVLAFIEEKTSDNKKKKIKQKIEHFIEEYYTNRDASKV